jgi:pimeloyl-ACP methyl ester carboxylesterase
MTFTPPNTAHLYHNPDGFRAVQRHYAHMLRTYTTPIETFFVPTRFGQTHLTVAGAAQNPPLLLVHGLANPSAVWRPNIEALAQHFLVYAVDVIGDAGRSASKRPSMLDSSYADWLQDVITTLALERVNLVGMSLGGWIALTTALHHPSRVERMVLVAPAGFITLNTSLLTQAAFSLPHTLWQTRFAIPNLLAKLVNYGDRDVRELIYLVAKHHRAKRVPPVPILSERELGRIHTPTNILIGEHDEMFRAHRLMKRARHMPGFAGGEILDNAGHGLNATDPGFVNRRIQAFLG